jgi:hypothetical protein
MAPRPATADVHQDEPDGTADGRVGAKARSEKPSARVHPDRARGRPADDDERGNRVRGRLDAVEVERGLEHGRDRRDNDGEARGLASRHDRVDGELLDAGLAPKRRHDTEHVAGL